MATTIQQQSTTPTHINVDKLSIGTTMRHITVRLMRLWEARNFKRNGELMSLDLLLLDEKDCFIQASIHHRRIPNFQSHLRVGELHLIRNFEVIQASDRYKVTDNKLSIRFDDATEVLLVPEDTCSIKKEKFRFYTYLQYTSLANSNLQLPDVVGQIMSVQGSNLENPNATQKIVLIFMLREGTTVRLTVWDEQAAEFRRQFNQAGNQNHVMVCTCVNPKIFAGTLYLNTTGASKFYFKSDLEAINNYMKELGIEDHTKSPTIEDEKLSENLETWFINKILEYTKSKTAKEKEVICRATVASIFGRNGWNYVACAKCSKKLTRSAHSFVCNTCHDTTAIGVLKFRIELEVLDGETRTRFVLFDRDGRKLTNNTAETLNTNQNESSPNALGSLPIPITEIVGRTLDFQVKVTNFNITSGVQSFTVSRVLKEIDVQKKQVKETKGELFAESSEVVSGNSKNDQLEGEPTKQLSKKPRLE